MKFRQVLLYIGKRDIAVPPHLNADGFGIGWYVDVPDEENIIEEWHPEDNAVGGAGQDPSVRE